MKRVFYPRSMKIPSSSFLGILHQTDHNLEVMTEAKGRVTALMVSMRLILTALSIQGVSYFYNDTFCELGLAMLLFLAAGMWIGYRLVKTEGLFLKEE